MLKFFELFYTAYYTTFMVDLTAKMPDSTTLDPQHEMVMQLQDYLQTVENPYGNFIMGETVISNYRGILSLELTGENHKRFEFAQPIRIDGLHMHSFYDYVITLTDSINGLIGRSSEVDNLRFYMTEIDTGPYEYMDELLKDGTFYRSTGQMPTKIPTKYRFSFGFSSDAEEFGGTQDKFADIHAKLVYDEANQCYKIKGFEITFHDMEAKKLNMIVLNLIVYGMPLIRA